MVNISTMLFLWGSLMKLWLHKIIKSDVIRWVQKLESLIEKTGKFGDS